MSPPDAAAVPELSFIIPVVERYGDLARLYEEYAAEAERLGRRAEFIFVVDYRQRQALPELRELQRRARQEIVLVVLGGAFGESASLTVGLERARGEIVVTLASYFQVDPAGLETAIARLEEGADLVVGRRHPRIDSWFNRLQSWIFHLIVRLMTGARFGDISCGFRVMRPELSRELAVYGGLHRFIPILAARRGFVVVELGLPQRREDTSTRYYGLAIYLKRLLDVLTVFFLMKFTQRPLRFFGILGLLLAGGGFGITAYLGIYRLLRLGPIAHRPLLLLGVLLAVLGIQILSIGLVAEIIIFTHARQIGHYRIAEIVHSHGTPEPALAEEGETTRR